MMNNSDVTGNSNNIDSRILEDANHFRRILGANLKQIALFGSCTAQSPDQSNDIDLALFMEDPDLMEVQNALGRRKFNFAVEGSKISASYSGGGGISPMSGIGKTYDIVVLYHKNPNKQFMDMNRDKIVYL